MRPFPRCTPSRAGLVLTLGLAAACSPTSAASSPALGSSSVQEVQVAIVEVRARDVQRSVTLPTTVRALQSAELFANLSGYLESISVDLGDEVVAGQELAVLSVPEMGVQLEVARARLARGRAEVERARAVVSEAEAGVGQARARATAAEAELARIGRTRREKQAELAYAESERARWQGLLEAQPAIEARKLDEAALRVESAAAGLALVDADEATGAAQVELARAGVAQAQAAVLRTQAELEAARASLPVLEAEIRELEARGDYARLRAPFDGVVTGRRVDPGAFVRSASGNSAARPLLTIRRVDRVRLEVDVPMDSLAALEVGDAVVFEHIPALVGARFEGTLTRVSEALGERSRTMRAEVELENPVAANGRRPLRHGYYGQLTIALEHFPDLATLPASAVFSVQGRRFVQRVEGDQVRRVEVLPVYEDGITVGVRAGLADGDRIVASGGAKLADGQRVRVAEGDGR